jgi:hypothetical protein
LLRTASSAVLFGLIIGLSTVLGAEKVQADGVARWIAQLGSQKYAERQAAARTLDRLGAAALPALTRATKSKDPEVRRHAEALVQKIHKRIERDRLLAATRVHLVYRDMPVTDAVADFAKKTGFVIQLDGDKSKWAGRKLTLDTGNTTFWQAFDQFCVKAQLVEHGLTLAKSKNLLTNRIPSNQAKAEPRLRLLDGKPQELPTCYFQGLRIRALPSSIPLDGVVKAAGEKVLVLEACLEPRTRLRNVLGLCVEKATDERGKSTDALATLLRDGSDLNPMNIWKGDALPGHVQHLEAGMNEGNFRRILLRVKEAKSLRELHGTLIAEVDKPAGAIVTVRDILKASAKTFEMPGGGSLTVSQAKREDKGQVHVQIQTSFPLRGANGIRIMNNIVQVRRQFGGEWETLGVKSSQIKLLDSKGKAFHLTSTHAAGCNFGGGGITQNMTLVYEPVNGQGAAAQLVCFGVGTAVVDVPFVLKNVALPDR